MRPMSVSYTHLDVYKRQVDMVILLEHEIAAGDVNFVFAADGTDQYFCAKCSAEHVQRHTVELPAGINLQLCQKQPAFCKCVYFNSRRNLQHLRNFACGIKVGVNECADAQLRLHERELVDKLRVAHSCNAVARAELFRYYAAQKVNFILRGRAYDKSRILGSGFDKISACLLYTSRCV